jgi:tol-pal system protein YbgF
MANSKALLISCVSGALVLGGCASLPPEEDPVQLRLTDMETRLIRIERVVENRSLAELVNQFEQLQRETQALRGELEILHFQAEQAQERQRQQYLDLDGRIEAVEQRAAQAPAGGAGAALVAGQLPLPDGNDRSNYQAAFELLQDGRYDESANAFREFLRRFPDSDMADNAQYWLAETAYVTRNFEDALEKFQRVISEYPTSRKIPDALLKIGYCNYELNRWPQARDALQQVAAEYGETTAARLASQRLDRMRNEGN